MRGFFLTGAVNYVTTAQTAPCRHDPRKHMTTAPPKHSDEKAEVGWFSADLAPEPVIHPVNRDRLKALFVFDGTLLYRSYTTNPYRVSGEECPGAWP